MFGDVSDDSNANVYIIRFSPAKRRHDHLVDGLTT